MLSRYICACLCLCPYLSEIIAGGFELLSGAQLGSFNVLEGGDATFNCTVTGKPDDQYRIYWHIDWTPGDMFPGGIRIFNAEVNADIDRIDPGHGNYRLQYNNIIATGADETEAVHVCLLRIEQATLIDTGTYTCTYYDQDDIVGNVEFAGGKAMLFVIPLRNPVATHGTTTPVTPRLATNARTFPTTLAMQDVGTGGNISSIFVGIVSGVGIIITIIIGLAFYAGYRYSRYMIMKGREKRQTHQEKGDDSSVYVIPTPPQGVSSSANPPPALGDQIIYYETTTDSNAETYIELNPETYMELDPVPYEDPYMGLNNTTTGPKQPGDVITDSEMA